MLNIIAFISYCCRAGSFRCALLGESAYACHGSTYNEKTQCFDRGYFDYDLILFEV